MVCFYYQLPPEGFDSQVRQDVPGLPPNTIPMQTHMVIGMHPTRPPVQDPEAERCDLFHAAVSSGSPVVLPETTKCRFAEAQAEVQSMASKRKVKEMPGEDVMILPLGTGSAMPSKFRNGAFSPSSGFGAEY